MPKTKWNGADHEEPTIKNLYACLQLVKQTFKY